MLRSLLCTLLPALFLGFTNAKTVVFQQAGFPTIDNQPVARKTLEEALRGQEVAYANSADLQKQETLQNADLLVLPYGSAFPQAAWSAIQSHLNSGGNLLVLGGQPFRVPVSTMQGRFEPAEPTESYSREFGIAHSYESPRRESATFSWLQGYDFLPPIKLDAQRYFVLEGRVQGRGYMVNSKGEKIAAPMVVASDRRNSSRRVMLDFEPKPGYWESKDGTELIKAAAQYAQGGGDSFWTETQFSTLKAGEPLQLNALQHHGPEKRAHARSAKIELLQDEKVLATQTVQWRPNEVSANVAFNTTLKPGFYVLRGTYMLDGAPREAYRNGFWVEDQPLLKSGPALGMRGDFLTRDGKPYFPTGSNYFTSETNGWDFSGPRNAAVWEQDFAEMEKHGLTFVRTGVWSGQIKFIDEASGGVTERFLRNLEAYILSARKHNIIVNFTFFAFEPQSTLRKNNITPLAMLPGTNPYIDPVTIAAEQNYMLSIVRRFKDLPYVSWDLINEPSFSNPTQIWHGNTPNADPAETKAWHEWLASRYGHLDNLAKAWLVTPGSLGSFNAIPLPSSQDLAFNPESNSKQSRAFDYNLFAQHMFAKWTATMVKAIQSTGSKQLIDVGQDEGGVTNRVLNQLLGGRGVAYPANHTYPKHDSLLWDSLAAKRPGVPNIIGETGYQPVWRPGGEWRYDEVTGYGLQQRKWAAGFAGGTSGILPWDWATEIYFGLKRSDGSDKTWIPMLADTSDFAAKAAPMATQLIQPEVAIVLPQSLQLSTLNSLAREAQQNSVRALYAYAHSSAYVVGEYQLEQLGDPKLIIVPSPWAFDEQAWQTLMKKVQAGAVLLVSGRFDADAHFHGTDRHEKAGIPYRSGLLTTHDVHVEWPKGQAWLTYSNEKSNFLDRAFLPDGKTFVEKSVGKGKILFLPTPIELSDNLSAIGEIYRYALDVAQVKAMYANLSENPGVTICPARFPNATLYVIFAESSEGHVAFSDATSGKQFSGELKPGEAAMLLVSTSGEQLATYNWTAKK